jgi:putative addiction module killer protein
VIEIVQSDEFESWIGKLRDLRAQLRIRARIERMSKGNPGDVKPVGEGISELRVDYGPGYRVYILQRGDVLIVLLCGGDKSTQTKDIKQAKLIAQRWKE